jgi:hypothetical protein
MSTVPYISWLGHGAACLSPPGVFTDARATIFAIVANQKAMQALTDKLLNPAGCGQVYYEAAAPLAVISFLDIARCTSGTDVIGWLPGRECALWVPLIERRTGESARERLVFWSPYIFIDYAIGMVTGREIWGWPKVLAKISVADDNPDHASYACATTVFPTLSLDTPGVTDTLLRVTTNGAKSMQQRVTSWRTTEEADTAIKGSLLANLDETLVRTCSALPLSPCVALKQFRDPADATRACYQAICDSPVELTQFKGGGLLTGDFALEVTTCMSHPIVQDLTGQAPQPQATRLQVWFAAWSLFDFQALGGGNIVVAR